MNKQQETIGLFDLKIKDDYFQFLQVSNFIDQLFKEKSQVLDDFEGFGEAFCFPLELLFCLCYLLLQLNILLIYRQKLEEKLETLENKKSPAGKTPAKNFISNKNLIFETKI